MPKSAKEMTQGMQEALDKAKQKEVTPDKLREIGVQKSGLAGQAADAIMKRKKAMEDAMKEGGKVL